MHALAGTTIHSGAEVVIRLVGEVDAAATPELRRQVEALASGSGPITLDCSALTFIDAGGLGALVYLAKGATAERRSVALRDVSPWVSRLLGIGGLASMLPAAHSVGLVVAGSTPSSA